MREVSSASEDGIDENSNRGSGENEQLLDLDDEQGAEVCKTYLSSLERLMCSLGITLCSRAYRNDFTNSYKVLYTQMEE